MSRTFVLVGDESFAQEMQASRAELLRTLGELSGADAQFRDVIHQVEQGEAQLHEVHVKAHDMRRNGGRVREVGLFLEENARPIRQQLDKHLLDLIGASEAQIREAAADSRSNVLHARAVSICAALAVVITFLVVLLLVRGFIEAQLASEKALSELNASLDSRVTERTRDLRAANRELEGFSYAVAHDLRTPLRAISNYGEMVLTQLKGYPDKQVAERLERIRAAGVRMSDLIDGLLALSRLTRRPYSPEPVDLSALASELVQELVEAFPSRAVKASIAPDLHDIGDASMLRVLLRNLLENAWKFTAKVPTASIEFGRMPVDGEPAYYVSDNGVGFDPRYQKQILMPFERLHDVHEYPGTGLGLPTADRIVRKHGGTLWAEGKTNEGATFYFTLNRRIPAKERSMTPENFRDT